MNELKDLKDLADHAAHQDYQWMFIAMLIILLIVMFLGWRWITTDREKTSARLELMTDRHIAVTEKLVEVVATNTSVLHEVRKKL